MLRALEALRPGIELDVIRVGADGRVATDAPIPADTKLVSLMLANNETGAIMPVQAIAARARALGAVVHADATQACGRMQVDVGALTRGSTTTT